MKSNFPKLVALFTTLSLLQLAKLQESSARPVTWHPMKVHVDLSRLENIKKEKNGDNLYNVFLGTIIPSVVAHIEKSIQVKSDGFTTLRGIDCSNVKDIGEYYNIEINADLVIFFRYVNREDGSVASAVAC